MTDIIVIGAGPAGAVAALRAADLGARSVLVTGSKFGGMAANDGPVPVRTLAHAGRLMREADQFAQYGIAVNKPVLDYSQLLGRVHQVVKDAVAHSSLREQIDSLGVTVHENTGAARFADPHTIVTETGLKLRADKIIICAGGVSRQASDSRIPPDEQPQQRIRLDLRSAIDAGHRRWSHRGASRLDFQLHSAHACNSSKRVRHILSTEDEDVAAAVASAFREAGIVVRENFGVIEFV